METLKDFLWPIVSLGGLGAFIDFLIGKSRGWSSLAGGGLESAIRWTTNSEPLLDFNC